MDDTVLDAHLYALSVIDPCPHPEIVHESRMSAASEWIYYCPTCHKKLIIPTSTMLDTNRENVLGMIGLTFGEAVKQRLSRFT